MHREKYLAGALEDAGFRLLEMSPAVLRAELGTDVEGLVAVAARSVDDPPLPQ
jgi:predicted TPR repeat methyltransferase